MDQKTVKPARKEGYCARDLTVRAFLFGNTPRAGQESSFTEVSGAPRPDRSRRPRPPRPPYYPLLVPPLTAPILPITRPTRHAPLPHPARTMTRTAGTMSTHADTGNDIIPRWSGRLGVSRVTSAKPGLVWPVRAILTSNTGLMASKTV